MDPFHRTAGESGQFLREKEYPELHRQRVGNVFDGAPAGLFHRSGTAADGLLYCIWDNPALTFLDIALLSHVWETPSQKVLNIRPQDFLRPFRDRKFRSVILFDTLWFIAGNFSSVFLPVYLLRGLGLSHSYISVMTILASVTGIFCNWVWGRMGGSQGLALCTHRGQRAFLLWLHGLVSHHTDSGAVRRAGFAVHRHRRFVGFQPCHAEHGICVLPRRGENRIPRRGGVVSNLMGYMATLAASGIQSTLEHSLGTERSISVLFAISAAGMLACLWHARKNLPKI